MTMTINVVLGFAAILYFFRTFRFQRYVAAEQEQSEKKRKRRRRD